MREERWEEERGDAEEDKMIETKTEGERNGIGGSKGGEGAWQNEKDRESEGKKR